jgi:ankyrin repeat protein
MELVSSMIAQDGYTALMFASEQGHVDVVQLLLTAVARKNEKNKVSEIELFVDSKDLVMQKTHEHALISPRCWTEWKHGSHAGMFGGSCASGEALNGCRG